MSTLDFEENEPLKRGADSSFKKTAETGSSSLLTLNIKRTMPFKTNQAIYIRGLTPLLGSDNRLFSVGAGYSYFFGETLISDIEVGLGEGVLKISPTFRYYAGAQTDLGYLFYTSSTAKKTDIIYEIGGHGGCLYRWKHDLDLSLHIEYSMGFGSVAKTTNTRVLAGVAFNIF